MHGIGSSHRVTVNGRVGKGRHRFGSSDGFGQHVPRGVAQRHSARSEGNAAGKDELASFRYRDHRVTMAESVL
jgi:hypothetical protein